MYNPSNPEKMKEKLFEYLSISNIIEGTYQQINTQYAENKYTLENLEKRLASDDVDDLPNLESEIAHFKENMGRQKAVLDHLKTKKFREIVKNILFQSFTTIGSGQEEEIFNQLELTHKTVLILDEVGSKVSELFKDIK